MPEAPGTLMLYPRGFFGAPSTSVIERRPRPYSGKVRELQDNLNFLRGLRQEDPPEVNENVEALYAQLISRQETLNDYGFRKKLYRTALTAFGTLRFDHWYGQQKFSPASGELHRDFLTDMLRFIESGERRMSPETWNIFIGYSDRGERKSVLDDRAMQFFGIPGNGLNRIARNGDLVDVIARWLGQPGGHADLLTTLHVLFGVQ